MRQKGHLSSGHIIRCDKRDISAVGIRCDKRDISRLLRISRNDITYAYITYISEIIIIDLILLTLFNMDRFGKIP